LSQGRRIDIRGTVQGVGFRPWVARVARETGVTGRVRNHAAGVTVEIFGSAGALEAFLARLQRDRPAAARFERLEVAAVPFEPLAAFTIERSREAEARRITIPPDLATCPACLAEVRDPANRRYRYPFTNCTECGPRFTIVRDVPYDRPATTMAGFPMCPACEREYRDIEDRRYHAQPNACPVCGPRLSLLGADGAARDGAPPLEAAAALLRDGAIVAVKGLGGFHLACDALSPAAVATLRERKRRQEKPFAVMVADLAAAEQVAILGDAERALLAGVERPIVLAPRRPGAPLAAGVAPDTDLVGLLLPYTPLHHLLLAAAGRPLVMTSGNLSEEPIATANDEAVARLAGIADAFLVHDRDIESPCDDSVARVIAGRPMLYRRSRGFVPRGIPVARRFARPTLAAGAHLKNTFCLGVDDTAWPGPHVGDLENLETYRAYEEGIRRLTRFLRVEPEVIAHDLHPEYLSTRFAREHPAPVKVAVQHHHAHVAAAMAEHGLAGPVLGLAWDGTGLGDDGTAWGGELLLADFAGYRRLCTLRPIALAGGDRAIREVWRIALAALDDAFDGDPPLDRLAVFAAVPAADRAVVRRMIAAGVNAPRAHGAGRLFDAVGALVLGRPTARHEGQVAIALERAAGPDDGTAYPIDVEAGAPETLDWRPLVRALVADLLAGRDAATVSARFHRTLALAAAEAIRRAGLAHGPLPVVISGGCFQNARLTEGLVGAVGGRERLYLPASMPPGDGGLSLGQALVADAIARRA
jgi:hydrogenase maturation protein HypF